MKGSGKKSLGWLDGKQRMTEGQEEEGERLLRGYDIPHEYYRA